MTDTMKVIFSGRVETRAVDHIQLIPGLDGRKRGLLMPVLREDERALPCMDGTVHVIRTTP